MKKIGFFYISEYPSCCTAHVPFLLRICVRILGIVTVIIFRSRYNKRYYDYRTKEKTGRQVAHKLSGFTQKVAVF